MYSGTIGSGKSYHALEDIVATLDKGKYVIANFPLQFSPGQIRRGYADRFMYMDDRYLMGVAGIRQLLDISRRHGWDEAEEEGLCLVVIDEATNYFPKEDNTKPEQRLWRTFFTQSRKLGYDFILIVQDDNSINKTIGKCIEYDVKHRKANNIFPFRLLNLFRITVFVHVTYWKQQRQRLKSSSTLFVKRLASMYQSKKMFADFDGQLDEFIKSVPSSEIPPAFFGNCKPEAEPDGGGLANGRGPEGEGPDSEAPTVAAI
ncbi:zonular occludens toxin domain-containing protein [Paenibacillus dendritiformis]|uniref:zonular occludens toxin domain-containing protein n=1 Tax=Paenibacillus dendritiformis TaxID=130049 RepID=UPI0036467566